MEKNLDKLSVSEQKEEAVSICKEWFDRDRMSKSFYLEEMEEMNKLYNSDHWNLRGPGGTSLRTEAQQRARPNPVENFTFAHVEGLVSEFSQELEMIDFPIEKTDEEIAGIMTKVKKYIGYKNNIYDEQPKFLRNLFLYGTGIYTAYWDPTWKGGRGPNRWVGDIRWESLHPKALFPDARCNGDINSGMRCHKAMYKPIEHIKTRYPDADVSSDQINQELTLDDTYESTSDEQILVFETWYKGEPLIIDKDEENEGYGMHVIWWAGEGSPVYLKHANYIYYDPDNEPVYPFIVKQCYPRENSIWGYGEAYFLKNPQVILNKTSEIILEGHIHQALGQTIFNKSAMDRQQQKMVEQYGNLAGMWFPVQDIHGVKKLFPAGIPSSLQSEVQRLQRTMESIVGRFDISQGKTPGSVTAFRALSLLAARAEVRLRSKEMSIMTAYAEVGRYINNLIDIFYTERRVYRIIGDKKEVDTVEYGEFRADEYKKVYMYDTGDVFSLNDFDPLLYASDERPEGLVEGDDYEIYSPELDVECKVTVVPPYDRIFYMDMAKELFITKLIDAETFWYVLENGKFPPFEILRQKEIDAQREQEQMMQQQQQMMQQQPAVQVEPQAVQENPMQQFNDILSERPDLQEQLRALPPEEQQQIINNIMYGGEPDDMA